MRRNWCLPVILGMAAWLGANVAAAAPTPSVPAPPAPRSDANSAPAPSPASKATEKPAPAKPQAEKPAPEKPQPTPETKPTPGVVPPPAKPQAAPESKPAPGETKPAPGVVPPPAKPQGEKPATGGPATGLPPFPGEGLTNNQPPFLAGVKLFHPDLVYREGESLRVRFTAEREAHLYLIYHQADGKSLLLFPNQARQKNLMPAKQDVLVPDLGDPFRFRIAAPFGTEVFQVLAGLRPIEELDALVQKTGRAPAIPRELFDKLRDKLLKDLSWWTEHRVPVRTVAKADETPTRTPARIGLFIGVNKYQNEKSCKPMEELRRGAELMAKTFQARGALAPNGLRLITGEEATRANIEEAVTKWLPSVSQPGDVVFIFYTGHGLTLKNQDGTKPDGRDGVLTVYDNNLGPSDSEQELENRARQRLIPDLTLARWLQELPGRQIVLMLDSCHSGTMSEGITLARFFSVEVGRLRQVSHLNVVVIVGCGSDESVRTPTGDTAVSIMPKRISEAMETFPRPVMVHQAFDHYRKGMRELLTKAGLSGVQDPMITNLALLPIALAP